MRKLLFLAALPLTLSACASRPCCCPDCTRCVCPICNPNGSTLTPPAPTPSAAAPSSPSTPSTPSAAAAPAPAPAAASSVTATTKVYHMAPAQLVAAIEKAITAEPLNLQIASSKDGIIQTDWKNYEGEFHIARRWDDRTRYRISVIPDVNDPVNAARFEVTEETQRRSNSRANWQPADRHPERAAALVEAINARLP